MEPYVIRLDELGMQDAERVGGKNASLGEMIAHTQVRVPGGFATTVQAYRDFLANDGLADRIDAALDDIDIDDIEALAKAGRRIRQWILGTPLPRALTDELKTHWNALAATGRCGPFQRHGRGSTGRVLRGPTGNLSQRPRLR